MIYMEITNYKKKPEANQRGSKEKRCVLARHQHTLTVQKDHKMTPPLVLIHFTVFPDKLRLNSNSH